MGVVVEGAWLDNPKFVGMQLVSVAVALNSRGRQFWPQGLSVIYESGWQFGCIEGALLCYIGHISDTAHIAFY
jgi:hypothetical protein